MSLSLCCLWILHFYLNSDEWRRRSLTPQDCWLACNLSNCILEHNTNVENSCTLLCLTQQGISSGLLDAQTTADDGISEGMCPWRNIQWPKLVRKLSDIVKDSDKWRWNENVQGSYKEFSKKICMQYFTKHHSVFGHHVTISENFLKF